MKKKVKVRKKWLLNPKTQIVPNRKKETLEIESSEADTDEILMYMRRVDGEEEDA